MRLNPSVTSIYDFQYEDFTLEELRSASRDQGADRRMRRSLIVAAAENGVIGVDNRLPWRLPADLARFKRLTMGHHLIMGRKTYESIGRPLPGRITVVLTRSAGVDVPGVQSWRARSTRRSRRPPRATTTSRSSAAAPRSTRRRSPRATAAISPSSSGSTPATPSSPGSSPTSWALTETESHPEIGAALPLRNLGSQGEPKTMIEWNEMHLQIRDMMRRFVEAEVKPNLEALEHGDLPPYEILRKMIEDLRHRRHGEGALRPRQGSRTARDEADADAATPKKPSEERGHGGGDADDPDHRAVPLLARAW